MTCSSAQRRVTTPRGGPIRRFVEAAPRNFSVQARHSTRSLPGVSGSAKFFLPQPHSESSDRHETRVRPEFEPSALTPATFSLRRSSASVEGHRVSHQARRRLLVAVRKGVADEDSRPIIGLANATPTNGIELCRSRRARLGAHHFKGYSACLYRAGAYDLIVAHRSPQRGIPSSCAGETKAAIALGVTAAPFTFINS